MYDCIVLESTNLPSGVTLAAVLEGCDEREVANILDNIPDIHSIQEADLEASGMYRLPPKQNFSHKEGSHSYYHSLIWPVLSAKLAFSCLCVFSIY